MPLGEQGRQEVSGCPLLLTLGLACTWLLETHQETGARVEPYAAGYVTFGSLILSEASLPLHLAEGCPSVCVLALRARPPGCSVCHLGPGPAGLASFCRLLSEAARRCSRQGCT